MYKNSTYHSPNRLEKLPVSFAQLKHLKWLDLKDNPLCPALKQAAGDCITPNDCALCAKKVLQSICNVFLSEATITVERWWLCCRAWRASCRGKGRGGWRRR